MPGSRHPRSPTRSSNTTFMLPSIPAPSAWPLAPANRTVLSSVSMGAAASSSHSHGYRCARAHGSHPACRQRQLSGDGRRGLRPALHYSSHNRRSAHCPAPLTSRFMKRSRRRPRSACSAAGETKRVDAIDRQAREVKRRARIEDHPCCSGRRYYCSITKFLARGDFVLDVHRISIANPLTRNRDWRVLEVARYGKLERVVRLVQGGEVLALTDGRPQFGNELSEGSPDLSQTHPSPRWDEGTSRPPGSAGTDS